MNAKNKLPKNVLTSDSLILPFPFRHLRSNNIQEGEGTITLCTTFFQLLYSFYFIHTLLHQRNTFKMPTRDGSSSSSQLPRVLLQVNPGIARQLEGRIGMLERLRCKSFF